MGATQFPCSSCGAGLVFEPGTTELVCRYCGAANTIPESPAAVEELDFEAELAKLDSEADSTEIIQTQCKSCRANVRMESNASSQNCPFCGSDLVATGISAKLIKPRSVLPFAIDRAKARASFRTWISSRWFAPSALVRMATVEGDTVYKGEAASGLAGVYMPYWTYDCVATTSYAGQRGDDYWVTVPRTVVVNGKTQTRLVQERRTRWTPVSGVVVNGFDDVLVIASDALPNDMLSAIEQWDVEHLTPYRDEYLSGFRTQTYSLGLREGFGVAQVKMEPAITAAIRSDIGGDHQVIASARSSYSRITYKHILVPVWVSAYRYEGKVYRFLVNARTGSVHGQRPYSATKITLFVLACLAAIALIVLFVRSH
jgi:predicted RNA-binding Zn-ribbon protein involved in translation (DUF1610 family)